MHGKRPGPGYSLKRCSKKHSVKPVHNHVLPAPMTKAFTPKNVKATERKIFEVFRLRPLGQWSKDFLNSKAGKMLTESHWAQVKQMLKAIEGRVVVLKPPKSKKDAEELLKKTMQLPEQKFVALFRASLQGPLTHEAFRKYMELFKKFWPQAYKDVFVGRTPGQITNACIKQEAKLK